MDMMKTYNLVSNYLQKSKTVKRNRHEMQYYRSAMREWAKSHNWAHDNDDMDYNPGNTTPHYMTMAWP